MKCQLCACEAELGPGDEFCGTCGHPAAAHRPPPVVKPSKLPPPTPAAPAKVRRPNAPPVVSPSKLPPGIPTPTAAPPSGTHQPTSAHRAAWWLGGGLLLIAAVALGTQVPRIVQWLHESQESGKPPSPLAAQVTAPPSPSDDARKPMGTPADNAATAATGERKSTPIKEPTKVAGKEPAIITVKEPPKTVSERPKTGPVPPIPPRPPGDDAKGDGLKPPIPVFTTPPAEKRATTVLFSDSFARPDADGSAIGAADLAYGGQGSHFYLPLYAAGPDGLPTVRLVGGGLTNSGRDFAGMQFAASPTDRGESVGQDLNMQVDLLVPTDAAGNVTQAGPYFRSRAAAAGDGIGGGTSAGYWVALNSTGEVKVERLNPLITVATSGRPDKFDNTGYHTLEIAVQGDGLQVSLDGSLLTFEQDGKPTTTLAIPSTWDNPHIGDNDGTAGIQFAAEANRGAIGGQCATRLIVSAPRSLASLPIQSNFAPGQSVEKKR